MASTPSNRLKLTPSNSPYAHRVSRSPIRSRTVADVSITSSSAAAAAAASSRLSLKRVIGSTCCSPIGFDAVNSSFAYIAGGAVVVVDVYASHYRQRFYRARPTAVPLYAVSPLPQGPSTPTGTPKANDSRNRIVAAGSHRDSFSLADWADSPTSKTWTQRERIKSATCLSLSRDGRFLAVGETGYAPRVLIFNLDDTSSDTPLVSISEHSFGVAAVAWSADSRYLASLGAPNDGFLYLWKIDSRTGAARLFQQNRCTSYVRGIVWLGSTSLVTFGVRHIKVWRVEDGPPGSTSPTKVKYGSDGHVSTPPSYPQSLPSALQQQQQQQSPFLQQQRTLPGRNILLGSLLEATFCCAASLPGGRAIICSEAGDVCLLDSSNSINKQMKLTRLRDVGFPISCVSVRQDKVYIAGKASQSIAVSLDDLLLECPRDDSVPPPSTSSFTASPIFASKRTMSTTTPSARSAFSSLNTPLGSAQSGLVAIGFLASHVVTIDTNQTIDIFSGVDHVPGAEPAPGVQRVPIPGHGEPILGVQALSVPNEANAAFFTWSGSGKVLLWDVEGQVKSSLQIPVEQVALENELGPPNQLTIVRATRGGKLFVTADRQGVLRVLDFATKTFLIETKAHSSYCQSIALYETDAKLLLATCGRDRTAQLFRRRRQDGAVEHFQTLEFAAKVVQVVLTPDDKVITCSFDRTLQIHDLVTKEDDPDAVAAIPSRVVTLKASPTSMVLAPDAKSVFVTLLDRTICQYDLATSRLISSFKCLDEGGTETAVLDALVYGTQATAPPQPSHPSSSSSSSSSSSLTNDTAFLLGLSNTDKSVRLYNAQTGAFLDREWGHTEAINGVALVDGNEGTDGNKDDSSKTMAFAGGCRKVVSVGSDGTIMIWALDLRDPVGPAGLPARSRDPSPVKDGASINGTTSVTSARPPLRRVLSKAELAEFQRPSPTTSGSGGTGLGSGATGGGVGIGGGGSTPNGRRSPTRSLTRRSSRYSLAGGGAGAGTARTPITVLLNNPASAIAEDTPSSSSRRASAGSGQGSPPMPVSPKAKVRRRPSLPAMSTTAGSASTPTGPSSGAGGTMRKKGSASNLRGSYGFGSLSMATEQTCRQLRAYRKRLASTDAIAQDVLIELDQELRLTVAALGDRAIRSKAMSEELDGLLDEKLERLVTLLDEKWRLQKQQSPTKEARPSRETKNSVKESRPQRGHTPHRLQRHRPHERSGSGTSADSEDAGGGGAGVGGGGGGGGSSDGAGGSDGTAGGDGIGGGDVRMVVSSNTVVVGSHDERHEQSSNTSADLDNTSPDDTSRPPSIASSK